MRWPTRKDAELYRYGVHGKDFTAYFTVDPKLTYHVRIKLCQADAPSAPGKLATSDRHPGQDGGRRR